MAFYIFDSKVIQKDSKWDVVTSTSYQIWLNHVNSVWKIVETYVSLIVDIILIASTFAFRLIKIFVSFKFIFTKFFAIICLFHFINESIYFFD